MTRPIEKADVNTVAAAAKLLRMNIKTVYCAIEAKQFPCIRLGRRMLHPGPAFRRIVAGKRSQTASA